MILAGHNNQDMREIDSWNFPCGEVGVSVQSNVKIIYAELKTSDDIMKLLLFVDAMKRLNLNSSFDLCLPYIPYGRQDRVCNFGESLSINVMANLINSLGAKRVLTLDPHSSVTSAVIDKIHVVDQNKCIDYMITCDYDLVVSPDAGAEKKASAVANDALKDLIVCTKKRDRKGNITESIVYGDVAGQKCLIIDDICDGGATFIALAKQLKDKGASKVGLHVTHGLFTKGRDHLLENGIDSVTCSNYMEVFNLNTERKG